VHGTASCDRAQFASRDAEVPWAPRREFHSAPRDRDVVASVCEADKAA
jgi:hypothetical protein